MGCLLGCLLAHLQADIWAFQELWHDESLQHVFATTDLADDYALLVPPNHSGQKIVCAAAVKSNILVGEPEWIDAFPEHFKLISGGDDPQTSKISVQIDSFSRPVLYFQIKPRANGKRIHVYVCHFKSKEPTGIHHEKGVSHCILRDERVIRHTVL